MAACPFLLAGVLASSEMARDVRFQEEEDKRQAYFGRLTKRAECLKENCAVFYEKGCAFKELLELYRDRLSSLLASKSKK